MLVLLTSSDPAPIFPVEQALSMPQQALICEPPARGRPGCGAPPAAGVPNPGSRPRCWAVYEAVRVSSRRLVPGIGGLQRAGARRSTLATLSHAPWLSPRSRPGAGQLQRLPGPSQPAQVAPVLAERQGVHRALRRAGGAGGRGSAGADGRRIRAGPAAAAAAAAAGGTAATAAARASAGRGVGARHAASRPPTGAAAIGRQRNSS